MSREALNNPSPAQPPSDSRIDPEVVLRRLSGIVLATPDLLTALKPVADDPERPERTMEMLRQNALFGKSLLENRALLRAVASRARELKDVDDTLVLPGALESSEGIFRRIKLAKARIARREGLQVVLDQEPVGFELKEYRTARRKCYAIGVKGQWRSVSEQVYALLTILKQRPGATPSTEIAPQLYPPGTPIPKGKSISNVIFTGSKQLEKIGLRITNLEPANARRPGRYLVTRLLPKPNS